MTKRIHKLAFLLAISLILGNGGNLLFGQTADSSELEYRIKAGFIFNLFKFVSWPNEEQSTAESWRIGILADSSTVAVIKKTLSGKMVGSKPVEVFLMTPEQNVDTTHVLFISKDLTNSSAGFASTLTGKPILVVGEDKDFARIHGIIGFVEKDENLRLQINISRARTAGLVISGKLASLADLVEDRE